MSATAELLMTEEDFQQISRLLEITKSLENELRRATIVAKENIPRDVVTMDSTVRFVCEDSGIESEVTLVHPSKSDLSERKISILSPLGIALLGLRVGQWISWSGPRNKVQRIRVVSVSFQPEAINQWEW